jgi:hypothetical protein
MVAASSWKHTHHGTISLPYHHLLKSQISHKDRLRRNGHDTKSEPPYGTALEHSVFGLALLVFGACALQSSVSYIVVVIGLVPVVAALVSACFFVGPLVGYTLLDNRRTHHL